MKYLVPATILFSLVAGANADTMSFTASIPAQANPTSSYKLVGLHQFNPALGTLNSVSISLRNRFDATGIVYASGKNKTFQYKWHAKSRLSATGNGDGMINLEDEEGDQKVAATSTGVNRTDALFNRDANGVPEWSSKTINLHGDDNKNQNSTFVGSGDVSLLYSAQASLEFSKEQGQYSVKTAVFSGDVLVTYDYTPAKVSNVAHTLGDGKYSYRFRSANRNGYVAGSVCGSDGRWFPAIFKAGKLVATGPKGDHDSESERISDDGNLDFEMADGNGHKNSYRWKDKSVQQMTVPGYKTFSSTCSNSYSRFVGQGYKVGDSKDLGDAFYFDGKKYVQIQIAGLTGVYGDSINANGDVLVHGFDKDGNCNFGIWNNGSWTPNPVRGKNVRPQAMNEGGDVAGADNAGNILVLTCTKNTTIPAPAGAKAEITSLKEDGTYAGMFHYADHDEAFRGDDKGFQKLDDLAGEQTSKYVRAEYVKNTGDLMGYDKNGNCYKFESASLNPANINLPLWMISGAKYSLVLWLNAPASQDTVYTLSYDQTLLDGPKTLTIAKGQTSATAIVAAKNVGRQTPIQIFAATDTDKHTAISNLIPFTTGKVSGSNLGVSNGYIAEGLVEAMNIHIATPAPKGGMTVQLTGNHNECAKVQDSVFIAEGTQDASFKVQTENVDQNTPVLISAQFGTSRITGTFTIRPLQASALKGSAVTAKKGDVLSFEVTLEGPAPSAGKYIDLSTSCGSISVPAQVFIPAGQTTASFKGTVTDTDKETVTVSAGHGAAWTHWNVKIN